jgi:hypothetical protein
MFKEETMESKLKIILAFGALLIAGIATAAVFLSVVISLKDEDEIVAKVEEQILETEQGDKVVITRVGTGSIKKLDLENGSIYFTEGWGVYVPNK